MAAFEYVALNTEGKKRRGVTEGDSARQVRQSLREEGLIPLKVNSTAERKGLKVFGGWWQSMSGLDQTLFTRQMATLVGAGLPVEEALSAVAQQTDKSRVSGMIMTVRGRVLEGQSLATALDAYPNRFTSMYRSTVAAGERSGFLEKVLENLADHTEATFESRRNVEMALIYPLILLFFALGIVATLLIYVVPDIVKVFADTGGELPILTQGMITISEFLGSYVWLVLIIIVGTIGSIRVLLARPNIRLRWDRRKLTLPLIRRISRGRNASRYASTLSILTSSGVPLVDGMNIASEVVTNEWLKQRLQGAVKKVTEGASLGSALEAARCFPPMFLHMIASGESSGELDTMLDKVSDYQQKELTRLVNALVRSFEPVMMLVMGLLVIAIVLAILLPILSMNQLVL